MTGSTAGEIKNVVDAELVNVFVPTTPNPTSGFLLFVPKKDLYYLDMSAEEGFKMLVSTAIVTPPDHRSAEKQSVPIILVGNRAFAAHQDPPAQVLDRGKIADSPMMRTGVWPRPGHGIAPTRDNGSDPSSTAGRPE